MRDLKKKNDSNLRKDGSKEMKEGVKTFTPPQSAIRPVPVNSNGPSQLKKDKKLTEEPLQMFKKSSGHDPEKPFQFTPSAGTDKSMPDPVKIKMENALGADFSEVRIQETKKAAELGALAFTQGNNIHFAPGQYNPESQQGQKLLGHELSHVVQQREGKVEATTQTNGVSINDSQHLEKEADEMGEKAAKGDKGTNNLQRKTAGGSTNEVVQRYEIEGPWNINDPVHETITLGSLMAAGLADSKTKFDSKDIWEYNRGVIFNDDPEGLLFDNNEKENQNWSSGKMWKDRFDAGEKKAEKKEAIGVNDTLTARSHYGDLQFLHGMGLDGEKAQVTKDKIMIWAEFTYKVAIDEIPDTTKMKDVPVAGIPQLFPSNDLKDITIRQFFHVHEKGSTQKRAIGSLLHLVQDSFAEGHVERENLGNNKKGSVESFHSYAHQDHDKHGAKDAFNGGDSMWDKIDKVPGGHDAMMNGAVLLLFYKDKEPWNTVKFFLENSVFKLKDPNKTADAGKAFEKK